MDSQERDVINGIFQRLEAAANQTRDPEAERFISEKIQKQPYAPYAMAQSLYIQEQALTNLQAQVEQLQQENARLNSQPRSGGFLSSLFGGAPQRPSQRPAGAFGGPQGYSQQGYPAGQPFQNAPQGPWGARPAGGGFLQGAMTTAMGVAGGMMLANVLSGAFSGAGDAASAAADQVASGAESLTDFAPEADAASFDDGGDFGGDMGGGDWA